MNTIFDSLYALYGVLPPALDYDIKSIGQEQRESLTTDRPSVGRLTDMRWRDWGLRKAGLMPGSTVRAARICSGAQMNFRVLFAYEWTPSIS